MALQLTWDNTSILANPNVIAQRALQRQKIIGGTFYTTGFFPANDLAVSIISTEFSSPVVNKIYEFKIQSICVAGGPTDNDNGIIEGMEFGCLDFEVVEVISPADSYSGKIDLSGTDIEGVLYTLKKQSDSSIVVPEVDSPRDEDDIAGITFESLEADTDYYIDAIMYATINGEIVEFACGGNIAGYQFTTSPTP